MKTIAEMTFGEFVVEARRLRCASDVAERAFMLFLRAAELRTGLWSAAAPTFDRLLDDLELCKPSRYRNAVKALDTFSPEAVEKVGMHGVVRAVAISDPVKREEAITEMEATADLSHVPLSAQAAKRIAERYQPSKSKALAAKSRIEQLEEENARLKKALRAAERECAKLRKKLGGQDARASH